MEVRSDLHIHSRYAGGTSNKINVKNLEKYASKKGLNLLGTGDFTHPKWLEELKNNLYQKENGILETDAGFNFVLTTEVSNNYEYGGELRKIHNVILAPGFDVVDQINDTLKDYGKLEPDGRPTFKGMSCPELVEVLKNISEDICIIPAHIWTPWYGMFGSKSGFDSIEDCYQDQTKRINAVETGLSCYDSDTEILTGDGWKKFTDVSKDDKICTLNKETEKIEYQHPQRIYSYNYNGKMYRIKTKRVDLLVTPNHKLAIKKYTGSAGYRKDPPIELIRADERFGVQKVFKKDGVWIGEKRKYFILPGVKIPHGSRHYSGTRSVKEKLLPIELWLKFFGLWLADGHTSPLMDGAYPVVISNNDESLLEEIKEALEQMGFNPYFNQNRIRVRNYQLWKYLRKLGKAHEKRVPKNIKKLSTDLLQIFFDYYIKGDGRRYGRNNKGLQATTTSPKLRDDLQEIALKLGMSAYWKHTVKPGEHTLPGGYKNRRDVWDIYFIRQNEHRVYPAGVKKKDHWEEKWIDYKGKVHSVTVPNSIIYVRRNGIPVWCGNSDPAMNWRLSQLDDYTLVSFSDAHSHWPWRIGRECCIFEMEDLTYSNFVDIIRKEDKDKFKMTLEFFPEEGKYHFDGHRKCNVRMDPKESMKLNNKCPECGKEMTIGVQHRVEELADRERGYEPENRVPYKNLLNLSSIISIVTGVSDFYAKTIWKKYNKLVDAFGDEITILLKTSKEELKKVTGKEMVEAIIKNRNGEVGMKPGYDGVYGEPILNPGKNFDREIEKSGQSTLDQY